MATRDRLSELLLKTGLIDDMQLRSALSRQDQWGGRLTKILPDMGLADEDELTEKLAQALRVPVMHLGTASKDTGALSRIDVRFAEERGVFPVQLKDNGKTLVVAMANPSDLDLIDEIGRRGRARVVVSMASETEIFNAIQRHYRNADPSTHQSKRKPKRQPTPADTGEDGEFKIVDMSGNTVVKWLGDIDPA